MARVFISYRRSDSAAHAGRLYDRLSAHFGPGSVFMDVDKIAPGEDFIEVISRSFDDCETVIVLIGPRWLSMADGSSTNRLNDPDDPVRMELANALERKLRVVPVLVAGATMPSLAQLPAELAPLSRRNAVGISDVRFHRDVDDLIAALEQAPPPPKPRESPPPAAASPKPAPSPIPEPSVAEPTGSARSFESTAAKREVDPPRAEPVWQPSDSLQALSVWKKALIAGGAAVVLFGLGLNLPSILRPKPTSTPAFVEETKTDPPAPVVAAPPTSPPTVAVDDSTKRAIEAFRKGKDLFFGEGVKKDEAQAAEQFKIAADLGHVGAKGALGYMYYEGLGVKQNLSEGIRLMTIAADVGVEDAQNNLAAVYEEGKGVKRDYGEALRLYRAAAEKGYPLAQYNLGRMYENGLGTKRDLAEARRWYQLAVANGDTDAAEAIRRLSATK